MKCVIRKWVVSTPKTWQRSCTVILILINLAFTPMAASATAAFASVGDGIFADGSVVVGWGRDASSAPSEAFVWDEMHGMRSLEDVLKGADSISQAGNSAKRRGSPRTVERFWKPVREVATVRDGSPLFPSQG